jgi:hypothetical protein
VWIAIVGCAPRDDRAETDRNASRRDTTGAPPADPAPTDSVATLTLYRRRALAIDHDTITMQRTQKPLSIGAGATAQVTAWRAGPVWRRLTVETTGPGFRTTDIFWLHSGVLLGAQLTTQRDDRKPAVDEVWFRNRTLYRWTDPVGRHLNPDTRSTQYDVRRLSVRLDSLLALVSADDAVRMPQPRP